MMRTPDAPTRHYMRATYAPDVSIGLAWGASRRDDKRTFPWLTGIPDQDCYTTVADILWNGSPVERYAGLVIDGGRAAIPFPAGEYDQKNPSRYPVEWVGPGEVAVWRLAHLLERPDRELALQDFNRYLKLVGFNLDT